MKRRLINIQLRNGIKIVAGETDVLTVITDEIFLLNRYITPEVRVEKNDLVLDIGSHVGIFSLFAYANGANKIISYEPSIVNCTNQLKNLRANNIDRILIRNAAVSNMSGVINFYLNKISGRNSIIHNKHFSQKGAIMKVESLRITDILHRERLSTIDFLKMDCEGSEELIINSTPISMLKRIHKISMEYHSDVTNIIHKELVSKLHRAGFNIKTLKTGVDIGYIYAWRN